MPRFLSTLAATAFFLAPAPALACAMYMPEKEAPLIALMDEIDEAADQAGDALAAEVGDVRLALAATASRVAMEIEIADPVVAEQLAEIRPGQAATVQQDADSDSDSVADADADAETVSQRRAIPTRSPQS